MNVFVFVVFSQICFTGIAINDHPVDMVWGDHVSEANPKNIDEWFTVDLDCDITTQSKAP